MTACANCGGSGWIGVLTPCPVCDHVKCLICGKRAVVVWKVATGGGAEETEARCWEHRHARRDDRPAPPPSPALRCVECGKPAAELVPCPECKRASLCGPCALYCSLADIWGPEDGEAPAHDVPSDELEGEL